MMASWRSGVGVGETPGGMAQHFLQLNAVADAADAARHEGGDVTVAQGPFDHRRQLIANVHVLEPAGVVAADFLVEYGLVDGFQFVAGVLVRLEGVFLAFAGCAALGPDLPALGLGDGLAALVEVVGDAGLDDDSAGELALLFLQAGELLLDADLIVQVDGAVPLPVVAGVETVHAGKAAGATGTPIDAVEEAGRRDDVAVLGGLGVGTVPVERVGVADALAEVADGAAGRLLVE